MPVSPGDPWIVRATSSLFYLVITRLMALILWLFGRWEVIGAEQVPRQGALIVVANHLNLADPPLLGASLPRPIRFMAKQELFDSPASVFIRLFGAFPVRRFDADLKALRNARRMLEQGEVLGMFPEGHRSSGSGMIKAHPGTALLALQSGATVLPVAITGSERISSLSVLFKRPRITVTIGTPLTVAAGGRIDSAAVEAASNRIMRAIAEVLPTPYRGVYTCDEVQ